MSILLVAAWLSSIHSAAADDSPGSLRVATWNVNWGNRDVEQIETILRELNADVFCLQETVPAVEAGLKRRMNDDWPAIHCFGHQNRFDAERFMVLSRLPLRNVKFHRPVGRFFGHVTFVVQQNEQTAAFASVHLEPFNTIGARRVTDIPGLMQQTDEWHQREVRHILDSLPEADAQVIAGDFNSLSTMNIFQTLTQHGFSDSATTGKPGNEPLPTWHWQFRGGAEVRLRIDYVLHSGRLNSRASIVKEAGRSDHFPLLTVLEWQSEPHDE
ncbi:MAG: endonuclease/exonuclease/phosphatase family protein [Planctomycetaceae bacterium]|nr:endonuclease/exonuclease/phosphatase family protein [Planctomycetaceae bacterium]